MLLLSFKAGLRAKEVALAIWSMVLDSDGAVGDILELRNIASKGKGGGRVVPLNTELRAALVALHADRHPAPPRPDQPLRAGNRHVSRRRRRLVPRPLPGTRVRRFHDLYRALGFGGASSHSGRRTFVTKAAKAVISVGGSLRDVQQLVGHASLATTQKYIEGDTEAKRKLVNLI